MNRNQKNQQKESASVNSKTNQNADLQKTNLSAIAEIVKDKDIKSAKKDKISLYRYPEGMDKNKINGDEGKKWRNHKRNKMQSFANNVFHYAKIEDEKGLQETIEKFDAFYKEFYILNDYSPASISNARDAGKEKNIKDMLNVIRIVKGI